MCDGNSWIRPAYRKCGQVAECGQGLPRPVAALQVPVEQLLGR